MKTTSAEFSITQLIKIPLKSVFYFTQGETELGYISAEETLQDSKSFTTFTPFTSAGPLDETRCFECAIKTLIKRHAGERDFQPCDQRAAPRSIIVEIIATKSFMSPLH